MARKAQNFDAFKLKLNRNQSRDQAVDEALRLLEENYFTSDDLSANAESEASEAPGFSSPPAGETPDAIPPEERFKELSEKIEARKKGGQPNEEVLDEVLRLLENARLNSDDALRVRRKRRTFTAVLNVITGLLLIFVAAGLIIVELPGWLKGPTLLSYSVHDGVTMSDMIAMGFIAAGAILFILGFAEFKRSAR
ncbi:MAG: hypothetical protein ACOC2C_07990 [Cyclonatronaceae bacterium]